MYSLFPFRGSPRSFRLLASTVVCALGFSALTAHAGARVSWKANGLLLRVMLESPELATKLKGVKPAPGAFDTSRATCVADIYRPDRDEDWKSSPDNKITCTYLDTQSAGPAPAMQAVVLPLPDAKVRAWGSKFDKPLHFTVDDATARPIFKALRAFWKKDSHNPWLSNIPVCGPDGSCTDIYFLNKEPTADSPAALACDESLNADGSVYHTRCNFLSF